MVVSEGAINNIMGGMENTAGVRLHSHRHKLKQRFDIVRKLGQGTYGKVQLALNKETGQEVAIKTIKKAKIETEQDLVRIRREIQIMSSVQHPQIIHIYEVFENREKMVLVMEYAAGGELYDYLSERKVLPEEEARRIFRQVASAVYYCHKHKICHRDLKLENILLDLDGNAKIADFGLSNVFDEKQRLDTFCGSPLYASPEIVKGVPYIGPEVDCWSLGVLLYTLVYGAMPFDGSNFRRLVKQITQGDFYEPSTPATASELIRHMLTVQSTERANVEDICNHWWVNEGYSESCLTLAEALANQTPVRLDLLLSLAPKHISSEHMLIQPDDEDTSQKSDSDRAPPKLKIPPPPALPDGELDAEPLPIRSHSLGAVPPPGGVSVDLLIEKKKREKEKKKKESSTSSSSSKKPPSRPPVEDEKKIRKKEEKPEIEEKRRSVKRESSVEGDRERAKKRDASTDREKSKKRDRSSDREKDKMKKSEEKIKKIVDSPEDINRESSKERQTKEVEKKIVKKRESSLTRKPSTKKKEEAVVSSTPSTSSSAVNKISDAPSEPKKMEAASEVELPKPPSTKSVSKLTEKKKEEKKADDSLQTKDEEKDTDKILKETAAKIEKVESLIMKEEEMMSPVSSPITSPVISPPVTSPLMSPHSSLATSPVRSRTGSESSTEAPRIKSESNSRRQSKIFSKAAMFDPALSAQNSISPPPQDKVKKITRPGALNLSDLTKKFEEKPTNEKKNKVITPFKVSDARKAFESKAEKSLPETPRRKSSNGSGGESETASPKDSLPTSPTKGDKTIANSISKVSPSNRSTNKVNRETSPVKKISKSPTKETSTKDAGRVSPVKREKSPRKEASPTKSVPKTVPKVSSFSKPKEETKERKAEVKPDIVKKEPEVLPISNKTAEREIPITQRGDSSDSSDSESEAEKMLRELSVKREKLEIAKKEKMKKVSEGKEPQSPRDMPAIREEAQNVSVVSPASGVVALQQENKDQKFATLPRGFKAKTELSKPQTPKALPRMSSVEEANSGEPVRKKSQVGIILQNRQPTNQYDGKRSSFSEVRSQSPRQEYRTEVQHTIGTPEPRAAPEPQLQRARRERIIPIMLEDDAAGENDIRAMSSRSSVLQPSSSSSSRTSSVSSVPRNSGFGVAPLSSTVTSAASAEGKFNQPSPDSLKKSRRERIIPIAVEGEGLVTPPISESKSSEKVRSFHRQGSSQGSFNRGRGFTLDRAESFSSAGEDDDEEEDGFQILTAESLFSTLLSRVRSLTRKMGGEESGRSSNIGGGMRRGPQPGANSETPSSAGSSGTQSGFWSSLYSPPRDLPVRTIPLSRGHSREGDPFENFAPPLWERSLSRNTSDSDSVFSEPSGPFSTLPRGWRARRSAREESIVEKDEELSSFTPSRRQFYSRTLSRDLPLKTSGDDKRPGNRNSWDASTSSGTISRTAATPGSTLPTQYNQEPTSRVTQRHTLNATKNSSFGGLSNIGLRETPLSNASSLLNSGEAIGRVGGHFEQNKNNNTAQLASPTPNNEKEKGTEKKQSVQQLKELVNELESIPNEAQETSENVKGKSSLKFLTSGNQASLQSPKPSKSFTSFQIQHPLTNQSGSNPNIVFNITISSPKHYQVAQNQSPAEATNSSIRSSTNNMANSKEPLDSITQVSPNKLFNKTSNDNCSSGIGSKNTFIPYNRNLNNSFQKNLSSDNQKAENSMISTIDKLQDTSQTPLSNNTEKLNGFVKSSEKSNEISKHLSNVDQTSKIPDTKGPSALEHKKYLNVDPNRRGRSEDLKATIDIVNASTLSKDSPRNYFRPYGKSKSRDITPAIEAASEKFTQLNSGTLRKISPFEAYRRSKSKEMGSAIDLVNVNDARMKSPPPSEILPKSDPCISQVEKVKTNFEKKFEKAKSPPLEIEKAKSPPLEIDQTKSTLEFSNEKSSSRGTEILSKETVDNSINSFKEQKDIITSDEQKEKEKQIKDSEKSKSVYKIITSKFNRSLSNLGEDKQETNKQFKETEEETNEKEDKFKLKRPSIFMKTKMEKSSSKTSLSENDSREEVDKEKKTSKFSNALNKFLGRKVDETPNKINKPESLNFPKKSTSAAIIPDKLKKPPRFRTKKFSKSHENLNRSEDEPEEYKHESRAKSVMPESEHENEDNTLETATKGICNHLSQIEINIASRIGSISPSEEAKPSKTSLNSNFVPSIASYGLSPALANKRNAKPQHSADESPGSLSELDSISKKKLSGEFSEDGSVTPTTESGNESALSGLEDIKEAEDESVMDRITRKSYYSRFNEMKRKPKLRRIDSKESMDQQLAAAKARLMQDDNKLLNAREASSSARTTPQRLLSISPPLSNEGVTRRTVKGNIMPRTISLPPEDGIGLYNGGIRNTMNSRQEEGARQLRQPSIVDQNESPSFYRATSITRDEAIPYRRQNSSNLDEPTYKRLSSVVRDDPPFFLRQPSVPREEQPTYRLPSVVRDETPTFRRLSAAMRVEPQLRRSSVTKDEPPTYHRFSSTNYSDSINDKRFSSVPREEMNRRLSMPRDENSGYHTLQYRKSTQNDDSSPKRYSSYGRDLVSKQNEVNEKYNGSSPTSPSISPSIFPQRVPESAETVGAENYPKSEVFAVATAAGKAAGEAAAAAASSSENTQRIPSPVSPCTASDSAAVKSAREELTRRLTPLTRLSTMGSGDSSTRPYRRTVTSGNLPIGQSYINKPSTIERPYRRTTTMDLPSTDSRPRTNDSRRFLQEPTRRYSAMRSTENGIDSPTSPSLPTGRSPYSTYILPTSTYSSFQSPPSMNNILRRSTFYRY